MIIELSLNKITISTIVEELNMICKKSENKEIFPNLLSSTKENFDLKSEDEFRQSMCLLKQILQIINKLKLTNQSEIINNCLFIWDKSKLFLNNEENIMLFNKFLFQISEYILILDYNDKNAIGLILTLLNRVFNL